MYAFLHSLREALASIQRDWRRLLPMSLGIVWGMASVMVLLAVARGFERGQRKTLEAYGDRFVLIRMNRAELDRAAGRRQPQAAGDDRDVERLRRGAPAIRHFSPMNSVFRARITSPGGIGSRTWVAGCLPEIRKIRHMPLAEGRFYNELDEEQRHRVIVLGPQVRQQLFGNLPALGQTVRIAGFDMAAVPTRMGSLKSSERSRRGASGRQFLTGSAVPARAFKAKGPAVSATPPSDKVRIPGEVFEVIGVLKDVEVQHESYVSVTRKAFIPFSTSCVVFDRDYSIVYIEPRTLEDKDLALRQFRQVMGARYGFEPDDQNAVLIYFDSINKAQTISRIFGVLRLFLTGVGILILAIGGLGVLNVVLVSVAARKFEIGLRKALGATPLTIYLQFFSETMISCIVSGSFGFLLGAAGIYFLTAVPLPQGIVRPVLDLQTAALAFGILSFVAVIVGLYPARVAAMLPPAEALRGGG